MIRPKDLCLPVLWALTSGAHLGAAPAAFAQDLFEIVEVPLVEVEVVVTDRQGRPRLDLERQDFSLFVDGEPQPVSFFVPPDRKETAGPAGAEVDPAHLVLLFDNNGIETQNRNAVIGVYRGFLQQEWSSGMKIMVATATRAGLEVQQEFTADPALVDAALERVEGMIARDRHVTEYQALMMDIQRLTASRDPTRRDSTSQAATLVSRILAFSEEARQQGLKTANHLWQLTQALEGLPGQRSILYIGGAVSVAPGEALLTALKGVLERSGDEWARKAGAELPAGVASGGRNEITELSAAAGVRGVSIYSYVVGGAAQILSTGTSAGSLTAKDSSTMDGSGRWSPGFDARTRIESRSALDSLAVATGGFVFSQSGGARPTLARIHDLMGSRYVLAFHPGSRAGGSERELAVEVEGDELFVRHRRSFRTPSWDEETAVRLRAALLFGGGENLHAVALEVRKPNAGPSGSLRVPITLRLPLTSLSLEPVGESHRGQASVFRTGAGPGRFEIAPIQKAVLPVDLPNRELAGAVGQMAEYRFELEVPTGTRELAVAVRDDLSTELSIVHLAIPAGRNSRLEPVSAPRLDAPTADETAPVRLPSAALLMSGQQGGNVELQVERFGGRGSSGGLRIPVRGWLDAEPSEPGLLMIEAHAYVLDAEHRPLARSSRRVRLDPAVETGIALPVDRPAEARTVRLLVRDLRTQDFGLVHLPLTESQPVASSADSGATYLDLKIAFRESESVTPTPARAGLVPAAAGSRRGRVSLRQVSDGLVEVLELAAGGETLAARDRLRHLEVELTDEQSPMAIIQLGKREARVVATLADDAWERLLPLALIWEDLIRDYRRRLMGPLSEHAIAMSTRLAATMARKAESPAARTEAANLLLSLSGHLLYLQRLSKTEQLLELAVRTDPDNGPAVVALAATREQRGDFEGAVVALRRLPAGSPATHEGNLRLAVNLVRSDQDEEAEVLLAGLLDEAEDWIAQVAFQELARLLARTGRVAEAVQVVEEALQRWPDEQAMRVQMAWLLDRQGRPAAAGDLALAIARDSTGSGDSPRFRYHRWYADGLSEVRRELARRSSVRAVEAYEGLTNDPRTAGGA